MTLLACRLALRNLRGGWRNFRLATVGLALGVATIAGVGSLGDGLVESLRENGRIILGGDVSLRTVMTQPSDAQIAWIRERGAVAETAEILAMAHAGVDQSILINLRIVDEAWPLYGAAGTEPQMSVSEALTESTGIPGALVDRQFLDMTNLDVGQEFRLGTQTVRITGMLVREPDRASAPFQIGPRVLVSPATATIAGLVQQGSLIRHYLKIRLHERDTIDVFLNELDTTFPDAVWQVRSHHDANPDLRQFLENLAMFITLVGLSALLVGGIGIASAVSTYLERQRSTIATYRSLGAPVRLVFGTYLMEVAVIAVAGVSLGLVAGFLSTFVAAELLVAVAPVPIEQAIRVQPLVIASLYGVLTALAFAYPALARTRDVPAASLYRAIQRDSKPLRWGDRVITVLLASILVLVIIVVSSDRHFAAIFLGGVVAAFVLFRATGALFTYLVRRYAVARGIVWRSALANVVRPGSVASSITVAFGIGLTVITAIVGVQSNLRNELSATIDADAPAFFFLDIQRAQIDGFLDLIVETDEVTEVRSAPSMRARIVAIDGVPVADVVVGEDARWTIENDIGATYAGQLPEGTTIVAGDWWGEEYSGPLLISLDQEVANGFGLEIGGKLTVNILGREIDAILANMREIEWRSMGLNFSLLFSPGFLESAPHTYIATARVPPEMETELRQKLGATFPNVTAISVRDVLNEILAVLGNVDAAVRGIGGLALIAGVLVLAETIVASQRHRLYDAAVIKVLGATRRLLLGVFTLEQILLCLAASIPALIAGLAASWAITEFALGLDWQFPLIEALILGMIVLGVAIAAGLIAGWFVLSASVAAILRSR